MHILLLTRKESEFEIISVLNLFGKTKTILDEDNLNISIQNEKFDVCVCYCYGPILNNNEIKLINCNIINLHPSYLPYGKGIYPIMWAAYLNHPFGCSIHLINNSKIDSGPILIREKYDLDYRLTLRQVRQSFMSKLIYLLINNFYKILNDEIKILDQNTFKKFNYYKNRNESELLFKKLKYGWDTTINEIKKLENIF